VNLGEEVVARGTASRSAAVAFVLGLILAAQALYAIHLGDGGNGLDKHPAAACEICLASAQSGDPEGLAPRLEIPAPSFEALETFLPARRVAIFPVRAAAPRGPPRR
jgi:hypothetical protein